MKHVLAQIVNPVLPANLGSGGSPAGPTAVGSLLTGVVGIFLIVCFVAAFIYLIMGGLDWITSGGDKAKLQGARDKITNAIVGLIVVAASWAVTMIVSDFVGIDFPNLPIPTLTQ